jgi:DNA-binding response OmpR family regulator
MKDKKILIVEDDSDVRLGYHVLLKAHGYETHFASDSTSAVSEARKLLPDLIILDLGLPAGDGFLVLDRYRANTFLSVVPVIVVSARDLRGNRERALTGGAQAYLQKPFDDEQLLALIREHLGEPQHASVGAA